MTSQPPLDGAASAGWVSFCLDPAASIDASNLAVCFDGRLTQEACARMAAQPRLHDRISAQVLESLLLSRQLLPEPDKAQDLAIALASAETLRQMVTTAGAIYWAGRLAAIIDGREVAMLRDLIGADLLAFAIANRELAAPVERLSADREVSAGLQSDGLACLHAWMEAQPREISARIRLKLPPDMAHGPDTSSPFTELGPAILHRAADRLDG